MPETYAQQIYFPVLVQMLIAAAIAGGLIGASVAARQARAQPAEGHAV